MKNKLVEEAPYHPGYEDAGFSKAKDRFANYESICLQCGITIYKPAFKTLTDKELVDIYQELYDDFDKNPLMADGACYRIFPIEIGRAILRKAQEK
jgi:hypothetical protein